MVFPLDIYCCVLYMWQHIDIDIYMVYLLDVMWVELFNLASFIIASAVY
jgi:hypothetical protein